MNKPNKCKNCEWYGKPYWSVINPCDNCQKEDYYQVMGSYYTEEYVKNLLHQIDNLNNVIKELEQKLSSTWQIYYGHYQLRDFKCDDMLDLIEQIRDDIDELKEKYNVSDRD